MVIYVDNIFNKFYKEELKLFISNESRKEIICLVMLIIILFIIDYYKYI